MTDIKHRIDLINNILESMYGPKKQKRQRDPLDTLIETILSQNTSDRNSIPAFMALKRRFKTWDKARLASVQSIEKIIKPAGLFRQKARRIIQALNETHRTFNETALTSLRKTSAESAVAFLKGLKGVGPKTIACVMLFSLRKPYFPVDTHILRIAKRLNLIAKNTSADDAHVIFARIVPANMMYELHINMIEHGRRTCHARNPECDRCPLRKTCLWYKNARNRS